MSKPRPISTHRELNTDPDKDEPSFSYEKETFLGGDELDVEDCLLRRRLAARSHHRREGSSHGGGAKAGAAAAAGSGNFRRSTSYPTGKTKSHNQPAKQRNASLGESDTVRWNRSQDHVSYYG